MGGIGACQSLRPAWRVFSLRTAPRGKKGQDKAAASG
jgi:hypothetical protein